MIKTLLSILSIFFATFSFGQAPVTLDGIVHHVNFYPSLHYEYLLSDEVSLSTGPLPIGMPDRGAYGEVSVDTNVVFPTGMTPKIIITSIVESGGVAPHAWLEGGEILNEGDTISLVDELMGYRLGYFVDTAVSMYMNLILSGTANVVMEDYHCEVNVETQFETYNETVTAHGEPLCNTGLAQGVDQTQRVTMVDVYPNPASDYFELSLPKNEVNSYVYYIRSSVGTLMSTAYEDENSISVEVRDWPKGIYFITGISSTGTKISSSFVVD